MNDIAVSIICATYNQERYIKDALDGFMSQSTTFKYEVLINDDASKDNTPCIIEKYHTLYPDIIRPIFQKRNQYTLGKSVLVDILLPKARGKYIAICEGDDFWIDDKKIQKQFIFMENNPDYSMCIHNGLIQRANSNALILMEKASTDIDKSLTQLIHEGGGVINPTASFFFRNGLLGDYRQSGSPVGDHFMLMELASKGKVRWFSKPMSVYRLNSYGSWTNSSDARNAEQIRRFHSRYIDALLWFDAYTDGHYHKAINERISLQKRKGINEELIARFCCGEARFSELIHANCPKATLLKAVARKELPSNIYRCLIDKAKTIQAFMSGALIRRSQIGAAGCPQRNR